MLAEPVADNNVSNGEVTPTRSPHLAAPWQPGQSGNPAGRPKGARSKLGELFLENLLTDFQQHGVAAIEKVREDDVTQYVKVVASILPKELEAGERLGNILEDILARVDGRTRTVTVEPLRIVG
jgi:hypothetical protein